MVVMFFIIMSFFSRCVMLSFVSSSIRELDRLFDDTNQYQIEYYLDEFEPEFDEESNVYILPTESKESYY